MSVIKTINIRKSYSSFSAINGVSLSIDKGDIFALIGPNGSGKSTLINCITGAKSHDSGSIYLFEEDLKILDKSRISLLPQSFEPPTHLTTLELISYFSRLYGVKNDPEEILKKIGLSSQSDKKFYELSGGQKRRICVGISIVNDPEIIFLDEPTTGIDPAGRFEIWELIKNMALEGVTVFLTTHYMHEVEHLANRVGVILDGNIIATGAPSDLVNNFGKECTLTVKTNSKPFEIPGYNSDFKDGNLSIHNIQSNQIGDLIKTLSISEISYDSLSWNQPNLETVYLELIKNYSGESQ